MECASNKQEKRFNLSYHSSKKKNIGNDEVSVRFVKKELEDAGFVLGGTYSLTQNCDGDYFIVRSYTGRKEKDPGPFNTGWAFAIDQAFEKKHPLGSYSYEIVDNLGDKAIKLGSLVEPFGQKEPEPSEDLKQPIVCNNIFLFDEEAFYIAVSTSNNAPETPWCVPQTNISSLKRNKKSITIITNDGKTFYAHNPPTFFNAKLEAIK